MDRFPGAKVNSLNLYMEQRSLKTAPESKFHVTMQFNRVVNQ